MSYHIPREYSSSTRNITVTVPEHATVTIEPPQIFNVKGQRTKKRTISVDQPRKKQRTTASYLSESPSAFQSPPPEYSSVNTLPICNCQYEPRVPLQPTVEAIRLGCDSSPFHKIQIPLIDCRNGDISSKSCTKTEKWLGCFPDMSLYNSRYFSWDHRHLATIAVQEHNRVECTVYLMYVCGEKESRLPVNKYLESFSTRRLYGDGVLFKINDYDKNGSPEFLPMGSELLDGGQVSRSTEFVLKELLTNL